MGTRAALLGGLVTAAAGGPALAVTAALIGLQTPVGWFAYGLLVGAVAGSIGGPWIARRRPRAALAFSVLLDVAGVLLFPLLGPLLSLEGPMGGRTRPDLWLNDLPPRYLFTPIGFLSALPFLPAVAATTLIVTWIIGSRRAPIVEATPRPVEHAPTADVAGEEPGPLDAGPAAGARRARLERIREDADPVEATDRSFQRWVTIGFVLLIVIPLVGYLWLASVVRNIGY